MIAGFRKNPISKSGLCALANSRFRGQLWRQFSGRLRGRAWGDFERLWARFKVILGVVLGLILGVISGVNLALCFWEWLWG